MVYVPSTRYEDAYQKIRTNSLGGGCTVLLFVSMDADALCAARILISLLKTDTIAHKVIPVSNYSDITHANQTLIESSMQIKSAVFVNCGAMVDIQDYVSLRDGLEIVIIDSHRPFNLYNVYVDERVHCLDDGDMDRNSALREAFEEIEFGANSDDEAAASDDDDDDSRKRGSDTFSDDDGDDDLGRKRNKTGMDPDEFIRVQKEKAEIREKRRHYQTVIQDYYAQGSYYGESCAVTAFRLAEQLGHPVSLDLAWWAIVGTTSQFLLQQIDSEGYALVVRKMNETVRRLSSTTVGSADDFTKHPAQLRSESSSSAMLDSQLDTVFNPHLANVSEEDDLEYQMAIAGADNAAELGKLQSSTRITQRKSIKESTELRFVLLRHWSLDSAMRFSPYVATRLGTWSSKGRSRFDLLLARLGLSKAEAREPYVHLDPELKKQLYRRISQVGADYDMADATYSGYVRDYGWRKAPVSAADMVLAVLALLQCGPKDLGQETSTTEGFYAAYDSLSQFTLLKRGLDHAQTLQRLVITQGISMLERRSVKTLRTFRLAVLSDTDPVFSHPYALRQLALFLMQTLREHSKTVHARLPFVIAAPVPKQSEDEDRMLVLGITPLEYVEEGVRGSLFSGDSRNRFGRVFENVAEEVAAEVRVGFFDSSVMEIRRVDLSAFAGRLKRHL